MLNLSGVDTNTKLNHYTVLLHNNYPTSKTQSSLGYHTDCIYRLADFQYDKNRNIQINNTPAVIYSLSNSRQLNWKRRHITNIPSKINKTITKWRNTWVEDSSWSNKFDIDSNTVTIINPLDEDPLSPKNKDIIEKNAWWCISNWR